MAFQAVKLADNVYWVGARDASCRSFHGYYTPCGVTYNAYLIAGNEPVVIDGVKENFSDEQIERIKSVCDIKSIRHVVSNHAEFDHSGSIKKLAHITGAAVHALPAGVKALTAMYGEMEYRTIAPGKPYALGDVSLTTYSTPMVHWPDNAVTMYGDILFSNDAFGQHYASDKLIDTENDINAVMREAKAYYANIVMPYAAQAAKALDAVKALSPRTIAPSHGVVWTKRLPDILELYAALTAGKKQDKAVVAFDSMWEHTAALARALSETLGQTYAAVRLYDLRKDKLSDVVTDVCDCKLLAIGSPTHYGTIMPHVAALLNELKSLKPSIPAFTAFGSYGWGGGAVKEINETMAALGYAHSEEFSDTTRIY